MLKLNSIPNCSMKAMMPSLLLLTSLVSPLLSPRLQADPIVIDHFNGENGGMGFAGPWSNFFQITGGLTFADLPSEGASATANQMFGTGNRPLSSTVIGDIYGSFLFSMDGFGNGSTRRQVGLTTAANLTSNWNLALNTSLGPDSIVNNTFSTSTIYLVLFEGLLDGGGQTDYTVWVLSAAQYTNLGGSGLTASNLNSAIIGTAASEIMNRVQFLNRPTGFNQITVTNDGGSASHITVDRITLSSTGLNDLSAPEPSTWALCAGALVWAAYRLRRRLSR
jgi:hypothetical protein